VTREQALGHGLSRHSIGRLVESGAWRLLARGLFLTVPLEPSWDSLAWAGVLLGGQFARLGPESSGFLHHLLPEAPDPLDVLVPLERHVEVDDPWRFVREAPGLRPEVGEGSSAAHCGEHRARLGRCSGGWRGGGVDHDRGTATADDGQKSFAESLTNERGTGIARYSRRIMPRLSGTIRHLAKNAKGQSSQGAVRSILR
jgi:hypothetical protein